MRLQGIPNFVTTGSTEGTPINIQNDHCAKYCTCIYDFGLTIVTHPLTFLSVAIMLLEYWLNFPALLCRNIYFAEKHTLLIHCMVKFIHKEYFLT